MANILNYKSKEKIIKLSPSFSIWLVTNKHTPSNLIAAAV